MLPRYKQSGLMYQFYHNSTSLKHRLPIYFLNHKHKNNANNTHHHLLKHTISNSNLSAFSLFNLSCKSQKFYLLTYKHLFRSTCDLGISFRPPFIGLSLMSIHPLITFSSVARSAPPCPPARCSEAVHSCISAVLNHSFSSALCNGLLASLRLKALVKNIEHVL